MPAIWDDLRIAAGWAWSYLVLAELVAGNRGIGYFIIQSQRYLETDRVFAGILFVGILGVLTDLLFRVSGARLFDGTMSNSSLLQFDRASKTFQGAKKHLLWPCRRLLFLLAMASSLRCLDHRDAGSQRRYDWLQVWKPLRPGQSSTKASQSAAQVSIGVCFSVLQRIPWLTVRENTGFGLSQHSGDSREQEVSHWLSLMGLSEFADTYPRALSGGMRQRLALAAQ